MTNLRRIRLANFPRIIAPEASAGLKFFNSGCIEDIELVNCVDSAFLISKIVTFRRMELTKIKSLQIILDKEIADLTIISEEFPSLEVLALKLAYKPYRDNIFLHRRYSSVHNFKSVWVEYKQLGDFRSNVRIGGFPHEDICWFYRRLEISGLESPINFSDWPFLKELAISRRIKGLEVPSLRLKIPPCLRILCFVMEKREFDALREPTKYCERLLGIFVEEQANESNGKELCLEALAIGSCGISEAENGNPIIAVVDRKLLSKHKPSAAMKRVSLHEAGRMFPESRILGPKKGPWGWFRR
ncbi:hypothetical protein TWF281_009475 [Arthrobotrys megalospora]